MRKVLLARCDRCGANHGTKIVRVYSPEWLLSSLWWFTICPERQEPVYFTDGEVS